MTKLKYLLASLIISNSLSAQIKNPGFEIPNDRIQTFPDSWTYKKINDYFVTSDSVIKFSGNRSVRITNAKEEWGFGYFYQTINIKAQKLRKLRISVFIKTENANRGAWLAARMLDPVKGDTLGIFVTKHIEGSAGWEKNDLILIADQDVEVQICGTLRGQGTAWFDDITIEDIPLSDIPPKKEVQELIVEFLDTVQTHSLFTASIDWPMVRNNVAELSKGIQSREETYPILKYVLNKLSVAGDNHSQIARNLVDNTTQLSQMKDLTDVPEGKYLGQHIGYIKLPGFNTISGAAGTMFADMIVELIKDIDTHHRINGWVVDLRDETGGSAFPMLTGLKPILGNDTLGYFLDSHGKSPWYTIKDGSGEDNVIMVKTNKSYVIKNMNIKIAVLVGSRTASSGEITAISFIGKANTKLFGQPTGGFTTGNEPYPLKDGSLLILATSVEADRNMKIYRHGISPDVVVESKEDQNRDDCLEVAKKWILRN